MNNYYGPRRPEKKLCKCGSRRVSWILSDARGIYVGRVCVQCVWRVKAQYRPEIFTDPDYAHTEPIEEAD